MLRPAGRGRAIAGLRASVGLGPRNQAPGALAQGLLDGGEGRRTLDRRRGPPPCAMSGRPPANPGRRAAATPAFTSSRASKRGLEVVGVRRPGLAALPSWVATMAMTPEPICFLRSSARLFSSRAGHALEQAGGELHARRPSLAPSPLAALPPLAPREREQRRASLSSALELAALLDQRNDAAGAGRPAGSSRRRRPRSAASRARRRSRRHPCRLRASMRRTPAATAALADDLEEADVAGAADMGAAAELGREVLVVVVGAAHGDDAHFVAIFLAEGGASAPAFTASSGVIRRVATSAFRRMRLLTSISMARVSVGRERLRMAEVEAQAIGRDQRALLRDMGAEPAAQRFVQQVGGRGLARNAARRSPSTRISTTSPTAILPLVTVPRWMKRSPSSSGCR